MVRKTFKITNQMGLHMRPANILVTEMSKYSSDITIIINGNRINGKSIMNIMAACIKCGATIMIECDGEDENEMLAEVEALIESGFGED